MPSGIDVVFPHQGDRSLIVYGSADAIEKLRTIVQLLDVPQKAVTIRAEVFELPADEARKLGMVPDLSSNANEPFVALSDPSTLEKLRTVVREKGVSNSPIMISTLNNNPARIRVSSSVPSNKGEDNSISLTVLPRINGDDTITLYIDWSFAKNASATAPDGSQHPTTATTSIKTLRRVVSGESIIIGGSAVDNRATTLLVMTAQVIK